MNYKFEDLPRKTQMAMLREKLREFIEKTPELCEMQRIIMEQHHMRINVIVTSQKV